MKFFNCVAKYILDDKPVEDLQQVAIQGLDEGLDSPALILLAGLDKNQSPFLYDEYFLRLLEELDILFLLDKRLSAMFLAKSVAFGIVQNNKDVQQGCKCLFEEILDKIYVEKQDEKYVYDSLGLAKVYSDYVSMEELTSTPESWHATKTNDQLIQELGQSVRAGLIQWLIGFQLPIRIAVS